MRLSIEVTDEIGEKFRDLAQSKKLKYGDFLNLLIDDYSNNKTDKSDNLSIESLELSEREKNEVQDILDHSDFSLLEIVQFGTLQRARYLKTISEKENLDHLSMDELKKKSYLGVAKHRVSQAVEKLMEHNDVQGEKVNKVCITRGIVFKLTGSNRKTINEFFEDYNIMIDDHNQKHSLSENDNRKGKGFKFEALLGRDKWE